MLFWKINMACKTTRRPFCIDLAIKEKQQCWFLHGSVLYSGLSVILLIHSINYSGCFSTAPSRLIFRIVKQAKQTENQKVASSDIYISTNATSAAIYLLSSICYKPALGGFCRNDCIDDQLNFITKTKGLTPSVALDAPKRKQIRWLNTLTSSIWWII